ncbi:V-set and transmembrane domain-containing protein 5 [Vipera latastei]
MRPLDRPQPGRPRVRLAWLTLCLAAEWALQTLGGEISLLVSQPNINSSLAEDVLLSVAYTGEANPVIEWKHTSMAGGTTKIAEWKTGFYANISSTYKDRVSIYENGSLQLLKVDLKDSGYYLVTVRDELGIILYGTILLNVHEILYEDLHFVVVFFAFLTAVSAVLICLMWLCNKYVHFLQTERQQLRASETEETELQTMGC